MSGIDHRRAAQFLLNHVSSRSSPTLLKGQSCVNRLWTVTEVIASFRRRELKEMDECRS
jgi:hypothetical protein